MFSHPLLQHVIFFAGASNGFARTSRKLEDKAFPLRAMAFSATSTSHQRRHQPHPKTFVDTIKALVGLMAHLPQWKTKNAVILHLGVFSKLPRPKISCGFPSLNDRFRGSFNHQMFRRIHLACYAKSLV